MPYIWLCFAVLATFTAHPVEASAQSVDDFKQVFNAHMQKLRPEGFTVRTVLFQSVRKLAQNGGFFPFEVTATIHDYGPGYPANRYYGQTCVGQMDKWKFDMLRNDAGAWVVQGRMTVSDRVCKDNPSQGASSMPLASYSGEQAPAGTPAAAKSGDAKSGSIYIGEYACYGNGRLMAGMGFRLQAGGKYVDVDGKRGGTYVHDAGAASVAFHGGFLDGQTGRNVRTTGFQLTQTVNCEPWR